MHRRVLLVMTTGKNTGLTIIGGTEDEIRPGGAALPTELNLPVNLPNEQRGVRFVLQRQDPHTIRYVEETR